MTVMEVGQQSIAPAPQPQHRDLTREPGMSHSTSAPDLRLILATELPDTRPMYLPAPGSYAGALVPYTSPEVQPDSPDNFWHHASKASAGSVLVLLQGDMLY